MTRASSRRHWETTPRRGTLQGQDFGEERLIAPELIDLEVASVLRKQLLAGNLDLRRAELALTDLVALPLRRVAHRRLLVRGWELRQNLTVYDSVYVALAELLDAVLLTADARLTRAAGPRCRIELLP